MAISFTHPYYLFLLIIIPIIIFIHFISLRHRGGHALRFANFEAISKIRGIDLYSKNISILILTICISVLLIFSLAGFTVQREMSSSAFSYIIMIDSSKSMEADDLIPTRMDVAKKTAINFVDSLPAGTSIGVISFSGNAYIEQSLTQDKVLIKNAINRIEVGFISGTDLPEAVVTATNLLIPEEAKAIVLLSDGQINVGGLDDAISYANVNDVTVHSIAFGTEEGGLTSYGLSRVDEASLQTVAFNTNGQFFKATNEAEIVNGFSSILEYKLKNVSFDMSKHILIIAILLFLLEYFLINTRYKIFP